MWCGFVQVHEKLDNITKILNEPKLKMKMKIKQADEFQNEIDALKGENESLKKELANMQKIFSPIRDYVNSGAMSPTPPSVVKRGRGRPRGSSSGRGRGRG